jgi:hypothetical protein
VAWDAVQLSSPTLHVHGSSEWVRGHTGEQERAIVMHG